MAIVATIVLVTKAKLACLSITAFALASCDKSGNTTDPGNTSSKKPRIETRADAAMTRPAATAPEEVSSEPLTSEQMIAEFNTSGIADVPKDIADTIIRKAASAGTPEEQTRFIGEQSAAWKHISGFKESINDIPEHMKAELLTRLSGKHGDSWKEMATELDEQVAASAKVMELRLNGIPGMSPDDSQDLFIHALEKYGPDYKTILSSVLESATK